MKDNFPNFEQWMEIRDKALEKGLEAGCRIVVKLTEKTVQFLDLAEKYVPGLKEKLEPFIGSFPSEGAETPCCCVPVQEVREEPEVVPVFEPPKAAARSLRAQLDALDREHLASIFVRNQFLKVLYLMSVADKKWLAPQEISDMGDQRGFAVLPQNVRKVIQQKGIDQGMIKVRERAESRKGAKEYQITSRGENLLRSELNLV